MSTDELSAQPDKMLVGEGWVGEVVTNWRWVTNPPRGKHNSKVLDATETGISPAVWKSADRV